MKRWVMSRELWFAVALAVVAWIAVTVGCGAAVVAGEGESGSGGDACRDAVGCWEDVSSAEVCAVSCFPEAGSCERLLCSARPVSGCICAPCEDAVSCVLACRAMGIAGQAECAEGTCLCSA
ncbi:uncharacterized protein SOCE26_052830 [Sorangium cellulosum]|uniref:Uncharacterized protein n=1 Tax=Sorangium cellulosum TaxID=56 RepID=A0A2L0EX01_SORCE|nr:hypothetical protein [Sorangium cellulosum]AUX43828.1 uncharacterized protein SOCE26_052830 [Sorangium cellulosum]